MSPKKPPSPKCPPHQWKFPAEVKDGMVTHVCKRCGFRQTTKQMLAALKSEAARRCGLTAYPDALVRASEKADRGWGAAGGRAS